MSLPNPALSGDLLAADCPTRRVLDHVVSRWGMMVLVVLQGGTLRFGALRRRIGGVSEKMLAQSLRHLEDDGFVLREVYAEVPPRVEYSLTPMGREVAERVDALGSWIEGNLGRVLEAREANGAERIPPGPTRA